MIQIVEKTNGVAMSTNKFVWDKTWLCEQRNSTNSVTKRFFDTGEQIGGTNYFFTRDHLGSIREMVDSTGTIQTRYDYDPYGRKTKISGSLDADFAYAGYYYHSASGLYLTLFRAYDPDLGRWISRDPLAEMVGLNLYSYVRGNVFVVLDPFGLSPQDACRIMNCGQNTINNLDQQGHRLLNGWPENILSDVTLGKYYGCRAQANAAFQDLLNMERQQPLDDQWSFNYIYNPPFGPYGVMPHNWVEAVSQNPGDFKIIIDPWKGQVVGSMGSGSGNGIPISNTQANLVSRVSSPYPYSPCNH